MKRFKIVTLAAVAVLGLGALGGLPRGAHGR